MKEIACQNLKKYLWVGPKCREEQPGGGGHFHIASDMDVRQIRVRFFALKSAKGVFLVSKVCKGCHSQAIKVSNLRKIIISFDQIREILRNFFNNSKIYS